MRQCRFQFLKYMFLSDPFVPQVSDGAGVVLLSETFALNNCSSAELIEFMSISLLNFNFWKFGTEIFIKNRYCLILLAPDFLNFISKKEKKQIWSHSILFQYYHVVYKSYHTCVLPMGAVVQKQLNLELVFQIIFSELHHIICTRSRCNQGSHRCLRTGFIIKDLWLGRLKPG